MCLAVPGEILSMQGDDPLTRTGKVRFGGIIKEVNLAYTPQAGVGDYVIVHVGFALNVLDQEEAQRVFQYLAEIDELRELEESDLPIPGPRAETPQHSARSTQHVPEEAAS